MSENIVIVILTWESVKKGNDDEHSSSGWQMSPARWWFNLIAYLICPVRLFLQVSLWFDPILSPLNLFLLLPQVSLWFSLILSPLNLFLLLPQASCQWLCLSFTPGDKLFHKKSWLDTIIVLAWCKNDGSKMHTWLVNKTGDVKRNRSRLHFHLLKIFSLVNSDSLLHQCKILSNLLLIRVNRQGCMSVSKGSSKSATSWRSMLI